MSLKYQTAFSKTTNILHISISDEGEEEGEMASKKNFNNKMEKNDNTNKQISYITEL